VNGNKLLTKKLFASLNAEQQGREIVRGRIVLEIFRVDGPLLERYKRQDKQLFHIVDDGWAGSVAFVIQTTVKQMINKEMRW
jgi:hypothetical protein